MTPQPPPPATAVPFGDLDPVIHERVRLGILSLLAAAWLHDRCAALPAAWRRRPGLPYAALIGLDWADEKHAVPLQAAGSQIQEHTTLEQTPEALSDWVAQLQRHRDALGLEPHGLLGLGLGARVPQGEGDHRADPRARAREKLRGDVDVLAAGFLGRRHRWS